METTTKTSERVLSLIRRGAKLVFWYSNNSELGIRLFKVTLEINSQSLELSSQPEYDPFAEDPKDAVCPMAFELIKHPEVKRAYEYRSDPDRAWRESFVHVTTPEPAWVKSQMYD